MEDAVLFVDPLVPVWPRSWNVFRRKWFHFDITACPLQPKIFYESMSLWLFSKMFNIWVHLDQQGHQWHNEWNRKYYIQTNRSTGSAICSNVTWFPEREIRILVEELTVKSREFWFVNSVSRTLLSYLFLLWALAGSSALYNITVADCWEAISSKTVNL